MVPFFALLFRETRGDFANGFLFFIQDLANVHVLAIMIILFGLTFVFGGRAGKEVILDKKNFFWITIKYGLIITLAIIIYAAVVGMVKDTSHSDLTSKLNTYLLAPLVKPGLFIVMPILIVWLWATNKMRLKGNPELL
ncbi:MAG: hypothetical protein ACXVJV_13520, partial [Mucilaginibacter sp.]